MPLAASTCRKTRSLLVLLLAAALPRQAPCLPLAHLNEKLELSLHAPFRLSQNAQWRLSGSAEEISEGEGGGVRLTADGVPSTKGGLWAVEKLGDTGGEWEVTLKLGVWGKGETYFGDGLALWLTDQPSLAGKVFGARDYWKGLGVMFDTYDNGQHSTTHPFVSVFVNDGTQSHVHGDSGVQRGIPACHSLFRKRIVASSARRILEPSQRTEVKVRRVGERLLVDVRIGGGGTDAWSRCVDVDNVQLPDAGYYFGLTSSTGDLTDNHDVYEFVLKTKAAPPVADVETRSDIAAQEEMARASENGGTDDKTQATEPDDDVARIVEQSDVIKLLKTQGEEHDARLAAIRTHLVEQIRGLTAHMDSMTGKLKQQEEDLVKQLAHLEQIGHIEIDDALMAHRDGTHWVWPFFGLSCVVCAGAGLLYRRFAAEKKRHLL